jgi:hypothetical protein
MSLVILLTVLDMDFGEGEFILITAPVSESL